MKDSKKYNFFVRVLRRLLGIDNLEYRIASLEKDVNDIGDILVEIDNG